MGKRKRIKKKPTYQKVKITTGIKNIDDHLKGGFKPGEIAVFGPPNVGKSRFVENMMTLKHEVTLKQNERFQKFVQKELNGKKD